MSTFLDRADDMKTHIESLFVAGEIDVLVDRDKDIVSDFKISIGRVKGGVVVISWLGAPNISQDLNELRFSSRYAVTVITKPIVRASTAVVIDDIVETIARGLHEWNPDSKHCQEEMKVVSINLVNDAQFRIYSITTQQELDTI